MKLFAGFEIRLRTEEYITNALQDGYSPDVVRDGIHTPLINAILNNRLSVFQILLKYGANPNKEDGCGATPMCYAIRYSPRFVPYILKASPSLVNCFCYKNTTPLDMASSYNYKCVPVLLDAGARLRKMTSPTITIPDYVKKLVQKRNQLKRRIILFLALSKKTKAVHKDLLNPISKMMWELRDTEEESPQKRIC